MHTANQNLIIASVRKARKRRSRRWRCDQVDECGETAAVINGLRVVPSLPALAMAEAERFLPSFTDKVEAILGKTRHSLMSIS